MMLEIWNTTERLAFLPAASSVRVREVLNGEYYMTFTYAKIPGDEDRYALLEPEAEIRLDGRRFVVKVTEENRDNGRLYKSVEAYHIGLLLEHYYYDGYIDFAAVQTVETMLTLLAAGTPYTFTVEGSFEPMDIFEWGEKSKLALLHELREYYGGEIAYNNYAITFTKRKGANLGETIRYRRNLKGIKRTAHTMERITRLYGYGKNGLTIEGYGGHTTKYIDSQYYDGARPYMGKLELQEIDTQARLLAEMQRYLSENELPKVSYEVTQLPSYELITQAGDTVTVIDEELGYSFDARIYEYEYYPHDPTQMPRLVLANFRELTDSDYLFQATVGSKRALVYTSKVGAEAEAAAALAQARAEAYADGIVTEEEQARIDQAAANLAAARAYAEAQAAAVENAAVLKGVKYDDSITFVDGRGMVVSDGTGADRVISGQYEAGKYGLVGIHTDGSRTIMSGQGLLREKAGVMKPYHYLTEVGSMKTGNPNTQNYSGGSTAYENGDPNGIAAVIVTLPSDFIGKDCKIALAYKGGDPFAMAGLDGKPFYAPSFEGGIYLNVSAVNTSWPAFTVRGYKWYYVLGPGNELYKKYHAIEFSYTVTA